MGAIVQGRTQSSRPHLISPTHVRAPMSGHPRRGISPAHQVTPMSAHLCMSISQAHIQAIHSVHEIAREAPFPCRFIPVVNGTAPEALHRCDSIPPTHNPKRLDSRDSPWHSITILLWKETVIDGD
jgi:hypothetical protein